jgi:tRNA uridine 5-carbamoylmethylation protein Kti12
MSYYIVINGSLGSGKSTNAKELADVLNGEVINSDKVLSDNRLDLHEDNTASIPPANFIKALDITIPEMRKILESNKVVIIDGCFFHQEVIDYLTQNLQFPHYIFTLKVPLEVCIKRDKHRLHPIGEGEAREVFNLTCQNNFGIVIDASNSVEETQIELLSYLPKS